MSKTSVYAENTKGKSILNMFVGVGVALIVSLVLILLFALLIKWFDWSDGIITPANIVIKIVSIAVGVIFITKDGNKGALKGAFMGLIYILMCFLVFSHLNGSFIFSISIVYDALLGLVGGAILGVIAVNLRR